MENQLDRRMVKVDLKEGLLDRKVNIALVQLESPFYDELSGFIDEKNKRRLFQWHEIESRKKKIISVLENIKVITDPKTFPDIIVFPEYSIPFQILPEIEEFSKDYKIIIAGSDQIRDPQNKRHRKNVCPVIIQNMDTFFIEKNSLSEEEIGIIEEGAIEESTLEFHWRTTNQEELCLQIFICRDFLDNNCMLDKNRKGCIVVPMCSKSMKEFVGHQYTDVRYGKFVLFCNATTLNHKEPIMVGSSAVYGAGKERDEKDAIISLDESLEGVIFVKLDIEHPGLTKPTTIPSTKPVEFSKAYKITEDYGLKPFIIEKPAKKVSIINPDFFDKNLKLLRFFFLKAIGYGEFKRNIKRLSSPKFDAFGVLGDYDTVSMSFLSAEDELKRKQYLKPYTERGGFSLIKVEETYKFFGHKPSTVPEEVLSALPGDFLVSEQLLSLSKDWDTPDVSENERDKFLRDKLILGDFELLDLRAENLLRAFICLGLPEHGPKQGRLFERKIIKEYLCSLDGVKSLYKTTSPTTGFKCDFLLDIIDTSYSIFDTIIEIHSKSNDLDMNVLTNTYVVVEQLSRGIFKNLPVKHLEIYRLSIEDIIKKGESEMIEFKSSLKWDYKKNYANKEIAFFVAKTISAFMNYKGGILLIGVNDTGELLGLNKDFSTLKKKDSDGFEIELTSVINSYLGKEFRHLVNVSFEDINEKSVCKVVVKPSPKPVFLRRGKQSEFYIRAGNSSQPLDMQQANEYINMHWG